MIKEKIRHQRRVRAANFNVNDLVWYLDEKPSTLAKFPKPVEAQRETERAQIEYMGKINELNFVIKLIKGKGKRRVEHISNEDTFRALFC